MKPRIVCTVLYGLVAGLILSALRAPAGLDLTQIPVADGTTAALFRAGALIAVALSLDWKRPLFRSGVSLSLLALATTVGFALHGLFLQSVFEPASRLGFTVLLVAGTLVLYLISGFGGDTAANPDAGDAKPAPVNPGWGERIGLVLLGSGAVIALENLARVVRLIGLGLPEDDTVIALVFLLTVTIGIRAFGALLARDGWQRVLIGAGILLATAGTAMGLGFLAELDSDELYRRLLRFDLDVTLIGTIGPTALIAGTCFAVPGFLLGAGIGGARHPRRLASLLFGAAVGSVLLPSVIRQRSHALTWEEAGTNGWAWGILFVGVVFAAIGAIFLLLSTPMWRAKITGLLAIAAGVATPLLLDRPPVWPLSPWYNATIEPVLVRPLPEGLLTVEVIPGGIYALTLDRRRLTPSAIEEGMDADRIGWSWSLLDEAKRAGDAVRVLFVGQLTPARHQAFAMLGNIELERTAPWYPAMAEVEEILFAGEAPPPGRAIPPAQARRRIGDGAYDLVIVAPGSGPVLYAKSAQVIGWGVSPAPVVGGLSVPDGTLAVVWLDAAAPVSNRRLGERITLATGQALEELSVGVVLGNAPIDRAADRPALLSGGKPAGRRSGLSLLRMRPDERPRRLAEDLVRRLETAATGDAWAEGITRGLRIHFEGQQRSSPYETRAQQIEFEEEELRAFLQAAAHPPLDLFSRRVWEALAWFLGEKREIQNVITYLEPVAERYGPWMALDLVVAQAWIEFAEYELAHGYLTRTLARRPNDIPLLVRTASCAGRLERHEEEADYLRRALSLQPPTQDEENNLSAIANENRLRLLGLALCRIGDPEGIEILTPLLKINPYDEEVEHFLTVGPMPVSTEGYEPPEGLEEEEHDHDHTP